MGLNKPLRYYAYISDSKVDMLLAQIPEPITRRLAGKLSCNVGILTAEVEIKAKSPANRVLRLQAILEYLEESGDAVGSLAMPTRWIHAEGRYHWARLGPPMEGYVAVLGHEENAVLTLIGSARHLVGDIGPPSSGKSVLSGDPEALAHVDRLIREAAAFIPQLESEHQTPSSATLLPGASAIERIALHSASQKLEVFAFVYEHGAHYGISPAGPHKTGQTFVFGSPLFVALL